MQITIYFKLDVNEQENSAINHLHNKPVIALLNIATYFNSY